MLASLHCLHIQRVHRLHIRRVVTEQKVLPLSLVLMSDDREQERGHDAGPKVRPCKEVPKHISVNKISLYRENNEDTPSKV